jgi:hypothetical protein
MKDDSRAPLAPPAVVMQPTESGAVLMDRVTGDCFELNGLGAEIWNLLAAGESSSEIAAKLALRYDVPEMTVADDVQTLVTDLARHGLLDLRHR